MMPSTATQPSGYRRLRGTLSRALGRLELSLSPTARFDKLSDPRAIRPPWYRRLLAFLTPKSLVRLDELQLRDAGLAHHTFDELAKLGIARCTRSHDAMQYIRMRNVR